MGGDNSFHSLLNIVFHSSMEDISIDVADNSIDMHRFFTYIARETNENVIYNQNVKNLEKTFEFPGRRHYGSHAYTT